ncbi:Citrinin biosynthesis transcriptional activator [Lachnellula hyalina]|uniref:Citrinin biosynthesis transcriptional activator n=1 Tax=Lachnellula hyalina TaxID=1316788 RepID=A0A8H8TXC8_9HELO|nr:Citrinin biosynthesis transcriptional activator [Lachnellula hyalina]TVY24175.1 Citrinin biosynthesis transcriptional activator [Lachnellula hyalina]
MPNIDEGSGSEAEAFPSRPKKAQNGTKVNGDGKSGKSVAEEEGPAVSCQSCRRKKAKCSRRQPCSQCVRFNIDCLYDDKKTKPGLRTGAVENLNQRVVALENMFLGQGVLWQQVWNCLSSIQAQPSPALPDDTTSGATLKECTARLKRTLSTLSVETLETVKPTMEPPRKKRRNSTDTQDQTQLKPQPATSDADENDLPPDDLIDDLVEIYFRSIHPWIPILHVRHFRARMKIPDQRRNLTTIFHAIVSLCIRFSEDARVSDPNVRARYSKRSRQTVILQSMESFSVENLQALVICAFDTIGSGRGPSAWSIVGSMTRTVEQLQLSVEDEDQTKSAEFLIKRMAFLAPCKSWIEREERRRWNFSLTSADVRRRLPCEGALWEEGNPLNTPTPYFGVADKSTNSALPTSRPELDDQASIGGFAYCIEASESLSLVSTFFLRHAVNVSNIHDVQVWLMRFKELDLRLVQWKIFLPERWREACALNSDGIMDPNLTLAHITHNTAVGLLHQGIAYPSQEWQSSPIRLPSVSSAETCLAAATEVAVIAEKYLQDSLSLTNPQFAFCLFMSGRMLLAHSLHFSTSLPPQFELLTNSLFEISRRWNGPAESETDNLASKFASRLVQARYKGLNSLDIRQAAYSEEQISDGMNSTTGPNMRSGASSLYPMPGIAGTALPPSSTPLKNDEREDGNMESTMIMDQEDSPDSISLTFPPLPPAFQPHLASNTQTRISSPVLSGMDANTCYSQHGETGFGSTYPDPHVMGYGAGTGNASGFEDLNSFFDYSFVPNQRVSMFVGPLAPEKDNSQ